LSRLNFSEACEERILSRSKLPKLLTVMVSQKRSLPPVHTIHVLRPWISSWLRGMPPSMSWK
jgi:hypothetical protein